MKLLAINLALGLVEGWEGFREYAYPDPASPLARATEGQPWGTVSAQAIFEALSPELRMLSGDPWTVGFGATGRYILPLTHWSHEVARVNLLDRLEDLQAGVRRMLEQPAEAWEEAALISFAYNVGLDDDADSKAEGLGDSTLLRLHNTGNKAAAAKEFSRWVFAQGHRLRGLERRREDERLMYLGKHPLIERLRNV